MTDRIERLLLAKQEDIDTLGSELEIVTRERDRYRKALEWIVRVNAMGYEYIAIAQRALDGKP